MTILADTLDRARAAPGALAVATPTALVKVMIDAARKAGRGLARDFGELGELQVSKKGLGDYVSAADLKAEETLVAELTKARPGYSVLAEERGEAGGSDKTHRWIIDPLDGTTNFLHAIPHFAINLALEREGAIVAGVTYNPATADIFWSEKGKGAYLNDKRIRVAARRDMTETVWGTGIPFIGRPGHGQFLKELHQVSQRVSGVRRFGSAALDLAWVAAGRLDGFWERNLKPWDVAAGLLMVVEAGGKVSGLSNDEDPLHGGAVCAANLDLHPQLMQLIKAAG